MGKRKLCAGIITGAIMGGVLTLFDQEARNYTKNKLALTRNKTNFVLKNPSEAVRNTRIRMVRFNEDFMYGVKNAINAMEQVEETLDKVITKKEPEQKTLK